jgi:hypothetical protein
MFKSTLLTILPLFITLTSAQICPDSNKQIIHESINQKMSLYCRSKDGESCPTNLQLPRRMCKQVGQESNIKNVHYKYICKDYAKLEALEVEMEKYNWDCSIRLLY